MATSTHHSEPWPYLNDPNRPTQTVASQVQTQIQVDAIRQFADAINNLAGAIRGDGGSGFITPGGGSAGIRPDKGD